MSKAIMHNIEGMDYERLKRALNEVGWEREMQFVKWGDQNLNNYQWLAVLTEEVGELAQAALHDEFGGKAAGTLRDELIQVAAVAVQWLEMLEESE